MVVPTKVFIGNLSEDCDKDRLQKELENYGEVVEFDIVMNYGFAHYKRHTDAMHACHGLNGTEFMGKTLKVELSTSRVRQKPGMGGMKECFKCGGQGHWSRACPIYPDGYQDEEAYPPPSRHRRDYENDPYGDYFKRRYPPMDRYSPYPGLYDRRGLPPPPPRDPYARPSPDYYSSRRMPMDPFDLYYGRGYGRSSMAPRSAGRDLAPPSSARSSYRQEPY